MQVLQRYDAPGSSHRNLFFVAPDVLGNGVCDFYDRHWNPYNIADLHPGTNIHFIKEETPLDLISNQSFLKDKEALLNEINEYYDLPAGWDNESSEKTNVVCLNYAKEFVNLLSFRHTIPKFSAGTGEEVALYWEHKNFYLIIHFLEAGDIRFYVNDNGEEAHGFITPLHHKIPSILNNFLQIK